MADIKFFSKIIYGFFQKIWSVPENKSPEIGNPKKFIIIRQHNQLGDLLAGVSLFRAIKETYPDSHLTLVVSPFNYPGLVKNRFIDKLFIFDKKKIYNPAYFKEFWDLLKEEYDVVIVPVVVSISFTSNLISRIANAKIRIGPKILDGKKNYSDFFFDRRVLLDWRRHPDSNVSERSLDIVRPFGINTTNFRSEISFDEDDIKVADNFIKKLAIKPDEYLIGIHAGAGKAPNRWSLLKYEALIKKLSETYPAKFYLTGSNADKEEVDFIKKRIPEIGLFLNKKIPEVAALISSSDLFIANDTGIMHVAGTTQTPQISIFGPTNPFNWAPIGENKFFIRKSDLIDDVTTDDVFDMCNILLTQKRKESRIAE